MQDRPLTAEEMAAERVALELALRGVREGLTVMPAGSPWVRFFRDLRDGLSSRAVAPSEPTRRGTPAPDDLAA
jgi:hypothetical protein